MKSILKMRYLLFISLFFLGTSCNDKFFPNNRAEAELMRKKCIPLCNQWILSHAKYPQSFNLISFSELGVSATTRNVGWFIFKIHKNVEGTERLSIISRYYLLDSGLNNVLNYSQFFFDKHYNFLDVYTSLSDTTVNDNYFNTDSWEKKYGKDSFNR